MRRIVLDTNVLVASAYDELSASWQIVDAVLHGELTAVVSPRLRREYTQILRQAVRIRGHEEQMQRFLEACEVVHPRGRRRHVPDDRQDDKVVDSALTGQAGVIITNDRHLLELDPYEGVRILRPTQFWSRHTEERGSAWEEFAKQIGIGR